MAAPGFVAAAASLARLRQRASRAALLRQLATAGSWRVLDAAQVGACGVLLLDSVWPCTGRALAVHWPLRTTQDLLGEKKC